MASRWLSLDLNPRLPDSGGRALSLLQPHWLFGMKRWEEQMVTLSGPQSLYLDMTHLTCTHISLAKASHKATPDFKETGKQNCTCAWRGEAPVTTMVIYGASMIGAQNGLFKKKETMGLGPLAVLG